jgi:uncharacterized protein involved in exopolysaccharide biosynthesis
MNDQDGPGNVENPTPGPVARFGEAARRLDDALSAELAEISHRYLDGQITVIEAADLRISALQDHLAQMRALRELHFPGSTTGG